MFLVLAGFVALLLVCFLFWCLVFVLACVPFPSISYISFSSMMTWACRPHGVRTRVKNSSGSPLRRFGTGEATSSDIEWFEVAPCKSQTVPGWSGEWKRTESKVLCFTTNSKEICAQFAQVFW